MAFRWFHLLLPVILAIQPHIAPGADRHDTPDPLPLRAEFEPQPEEGIFVVGSSGGRILVSRDDGETWEEKVFITNEGDGDHGPWGFQNFGYDNGLMVAIFGWTGGHKGGRVLATDDGERWTHVSETEKNLPDSCGGAVGNGRIVLASTPWGGINVSPDLGRTWEKQWPFSGVKTHHLKAAYGDYEGGRFVLVGDGPHFFYSQDGGETWKKSESTDLPQAGYGCRPIYGNGVFIYPTREGHAVLSRDGGETWEAVEVGIERPAFNGLSFVNGLFVYTGNQTKVSLDGVEWKALEMEVPSGAIAQSPETGTMIVVNRGRGGEIQRSTDNGETWEVVFEHEVPKEERIAWRFQDVLYGKVRRPE